MNVKRMRVLKNLRWLFLVVLISSCILTASARRGGGGSRGGSRGSSSRGSSSRGSSSSSSSSSRTNIDRSRDRSRSDSNRSPPAPPPKAPESHRPAPKPSAPEVRQPASNPNFRDTNPNQPASNPNLRNQQQPPPYSPRENPPPYSPAGQPPRAPGGPPPPYSPGGQQPPYAPGGAPPAYSPQGVPGANYPRQPGSQGSQGVPNANYPRQPGFQDVRSPQQPGVPGASYPRQPGYPGGVSGANYPRQPGGIAGANYPRQPAPVYPPQTLGGHVWQPQSGMPAPAYMNYGGLPTGSNMYAAPMKKKGFLGSLTSMGSSSKMGKQPKYYGSYPSPYGHGRGGMGMMGGMGAMGGMGKMGGGFGRSAAMYTILPYMATRSMSHSMFRPRFGYMPLFLPSPFHHHHYYGHYHGGNGYYGENGRYGQSGQTYYDVYNNEYVGRCNRPITPENAKLMCNSTRKEVHCEVNCEEGYVFPDNTTRNESKCWHVTGVWRPTKNFPACKPVCNVTCLNGGSCAKPNVCGCPPEYRGPHCEYHFLKCDIRKLAGDVKIRWVCTHTKNETKCKIKCKDSKEFETPPADEYKCTPEGIWTPTLIPKCIDPDSVSKNETVISKNETVTVAPE